MATALQIGENDWQQIAQAVTGSLVAPLNDSHYQIAIAPNEIRDEPPTIPREQLYEQLYALPPLQSAIVQEAFFAGLSLATIASRHSIGIDEASAILQLALAAITQKLIRIEKDVQCIP